MKKSTPKEAAGDKMKKGYNEKNPGESQGAFRPDAHQQPGKRDTKSNTADKKKKQDSN